MIKISGASIAGSLLRLSLPLVAIATGVASAAEIKILSPIGLKPAMIELVAQFEKSSGNKVAIEYATVAAIAGRVQKGESADVAIATRQQIANLEKGGRIAQGSPIEIAKQGVGLFVRKGAPKPDISSIESFKRALLAAKSIAHADPARGGGTAVYVADLLGRLDIAADIKPKIKLFPPGVYDLVAKGDVEIGFGGISEIMADPSVELVGPLPTAIQDYTLFTAGVVSSSKQHDIANAFIQLISSPAAAAEFKAKGFDSR